MAKKSDKIEMFLNELTELSQKHQIGIFQEPSGKSFIADFNEEGSDTDRFYKTNNNYLVFDDEVYK